MNVYDVSAGRGRIGTVRTKNIENAFDAAERRWPYFVRSQFAIKLEKPAAKVAMRKAA